MILFTKTNKNKRIHPNTCSAENFENIRYTIIENCSNESHK